MRGTHECTRECTRDAVPLNHRVSLSICIGGMRVHTSTQFLLQVSMWAPRWDLDCRLQFAVVARVQPFACCHVRTREATAGLTVMEIPTRRRGTLFAASCIFVGRFVFSRVRVNSLERDGTWVDRPLRLHFAFVFDRVVSLLLLPRDDCSLFKFVRLLSFSDSLRLI